MKLTVAKADLLAALAYTEGALGKTPTTDDGKADPVKVLASHCLFRHRDGKVEVLVQNGAKLSASAPLQGCQVEAEDDDAFTIDGRKFKKWLTYASDAAITIESKKSVVTATAPAGSVTFDSLNPADFPFWDDKLKNATEVATVKAVMFKGVLHYASQFIYQKGTTRPKLASTAMREGSIYSTDRGAMCMVVVPGMEKSVMRIHGKDTGSVVSFLQSIGDCDVTVYEEEWTTFFKSDVATFGVSKPTAEFPKMQVDPDEEFPTKWTLNIEALQKAIGMVKAAASADDERVQFDLDGDDVVVSMKAARGNRRNTISVPTVSHEGGDKLPEDTPMIIKAGHLEKILPKVPGENVEMLSREHPNPKAKTGYTRMMWESDGCKVITVCVWLPRKQ